MKNYLIILILLTSSFSIAQEVAANATRPSASDNGYITEYGYTELELGWLFQEDYWSVPALLKLTPLSKIEVGLFMNGILNITKLGNTPESEIGDPGVQIKGQLLNIPQMAISLVGRTEFLPNELNRYTIYSAWSFQRTMFQLDATLGGVFHSKSFPGDQSFIYAVAFAPKFEGPAGIYVEIFGESNDAAKPLYLDAGISYAVSPSFILDTAYYAGLNADAVDWQVHLGFTSTLFKLIGR